MLAGMPAHDASPPGRPTILVAVAVDASSASGAVQAGADVIEFRPSTPSVISEFRASHPAVPVYLAADGAPGQIRVHPPGDASGLPAGSPRRDPPPPVLTEVMLSDLAGARAAGLATLVDADAAAAAALAAAQGRTGPDLAGPDLAGLLAIIAVAAWLGADAVRTRHLAPARRALDMTASIRGLRPPAMAVRGLA